MRILRPAGPESHCQGSTFHVLGRGGGSRKWAVALLGAHTPSKNLRPFSRMQAYIAYLLGSIFSEVKFRFLDLCELRHNGILRRSLPENWLPGIYIAPCATAIVPAVFTRAVGGGRVHHTAGKGVEDAKVRDNASGTTAATEPSDLLFARSVGGSGGARSARSTHGKSHRDGDLPPQRWWR
jgi:hypothetical protein